jgi:WD40 repeat protein
MSLPPSTPPPPLLDVLGACWMLDAPVVGVAWDGDLAGFGLGDGSVAMGRAQWEGAPQLSPCEGGTKLTPAAGPPPPMMRQRVHQGACLSVAAQPGGGFLTGGDDGGLARTTADGATTELERYPGEWVDLVAAGAAGWNAAAVGRRVHLSGRSAHSLDLPASVTALAFDAAGTRLAMAHYHGVTLWTQGAPLQVLRTPGCPLSLAWSPDGAYVICGLQENALHGWRLSDGGDIEMGGYSGQPRSLAFSGDGRLLASSGGPRVVCWRFDPPGAGSQPIECGLPSSRLPVCQVATHPTYPLIAAGYHNGAVLLCQPGSDDVLFVKGSAGGSVTALAWSADGTRLATGTQGGEAGLVALPSLLFRFTAASTGRPAPGLNSKQRSTVQ